MRGKELLQNIAEVDNDLILESENDFQRKKKTIHIKKSFLKQCKQ